MIEEIEEKIVKPYNIKHYEETGSVWKTSRLNEMLNYENVLDLEYTASCYNESMRL
jgi:hypothetical protein